MKEIIVQGRITCDPQQAKPLAIVAAELAASLLEPYRLAQHAAWKKKEIEHYTKLFESHRSVFEKTGSLDEYNMFKLCYISSLEQCETKHAMFLVFLQAESLIMDKSMQIGSSKR